jgi:hypothetical protein
VQTGIILRRLGDQEGGHTAMWQGLVNMDDAFYAADHIPEDISAHKAACQFLEFIFKDNKDPNATVEGWFLRR